jgi:hypothetical protein
MTQSETVVADTPSVAAVRRYIYCVVGGDSPRNFGRLGIGPDGPDVFVLTHKAVAAVISATPTEKFEISRVNVLAHQKVMEKVMEAGCTVLPVKFNTVAEERTGETAESRIVRCVLEPRQEELTAMLAEMSTRAEMGVKGLWPDMKSVFGDLARSSSQIDQLRKRLIQPNGRTAGAMALQMRLGEMVKRALEDRKAALEKALIDCLSPMAVRWRKNKTFGDPMFANLGLLVEKSALPRMESALAAFEQGQAAHGDSLRLRCVGPVPPSNFIELVITWDDENE